MDRIKEYCRRHTHIALSVPAVLCFIQFVLGVFGVVRSGSLNLDAVTNLLSTADGFESVILFFIMLAIRNKKS